MVVQRSDDESDDGVLPLLVTDTDTDAAPPPGLARFVLLLLIGWAEARALCVWGGFPSDGVHDVDPSSEFRDVASVVVGALTLSGALRWSAGVGWRGALGLLAFGPLFAGVGRIHAVDHSLDATALRDAPWAVATYACAALLLLVGAGLQARYAPRLRYLASRAALLGGAGVGLALVHRAVHIHHWLVGLSIAALARRPDRSGWTLLLVGSGLFVQGIGVYRVAPPWDGSSSR